MGRFRGRKLDPQERRDYRRAHRERYADRRGIARGHLGAGRHDHLRDGLTGDRPAAGVGGGGEPTVLTKPDPERGETDHLWPELLPGGKAVLYTTLSANSGIGNETGRLRYWICRPAGRRSSFAVAAERTM